MQARAARLGVTLGVGVVYFLAGKLGLAYAIVHANATPVWPPTGIALAAVLLLGRGIWPAIFAGAFAVNLTTAGSVLSSLGIAAGNTLEALVGAFLVERFAGGVAAFERAQDIFKFVALAGLVSTTVSATLGVTTLALTGNARWADFGPIWLTWWLGDAAGDIVVAPFLLLAFRPRPPGVGARDRPFEALLLVCVTTVIAHLVFRDFVPSLAHYPLTYFCLPPLLWSAFRFGPRLTSALLVLLAAVSVVGTSQGLGAFVVASPNVALLLLQVFLGTMAVASLAIAALVWEAKGVERVLRERDERLRLALEAGGLGTWEWTLTTGRITWSPSLEAIHGLPLGTFRGTLEAFEAAVDPEDRERVRTSVRAALERGEDRTEYRVVRPDGGVRWIEGRAVAFYDGDGRPERLVGVCVDVTEEKRADARGAFLVGAEVAGLLYTSNRTPRSFTDEDETICVRLAEQAAVAIQNARLFGRQEAARAEAEAANRAKDEFLAMLGHELRNPLGAISNATHLLVMTESRGGDTTRARDIIARQVQHLTPLVDDLLDVSRVVAGKVVLRLQPVELAETARRIAALHGGGRHVIAVDSTPVWVSADPTRLEQILTNLMANAVKYTPPGGEIAVTVGREREGAVVRVRDSGAGSRPEPLPRGFDLVVQGDRSLERSGGGLGIGLTLVRHLVQLHGGTVEAGSEGPGRGSTFTVRLPVLAVAPAPAGAASAPLAGPARRG